MGLGKGLGGCYGCIKYLMFGFNFLFWLLGCAILGVGIWVRVDPNFKDYVDGSQNFYYLYTGAYILICVGVVIMIIGFLGCCGAIRESQCMLATFFIFLFIIFAVLLAAGVWAVVAKDTVKKSVTETLQEAVKQYDENMASKNLMDNVQENFQCCGASGGMKDYEQHGPPQSCKYRHYPTACDNKVFEYFAENLAIIAGVAIGIGFVMVFGLIFSCFLCCTIRNAGKRQRF